MLNILPLNTILFCSISEFKRKEKRMEKLVWAKTSKQREQRISNSNFPISSIYDQNSSRERHALQISYTSVLFRILTMFCFSKHRFYLLLMKKKTQTNILAEGDLQ